MIAIIDSLTAEYEQQFKTMLQDMSSDPELMVDQLVSWLLEDAAEFETVAVFRELWSMALRDEIIREKVDDFYDRHMADLASRVEEVYPKVGPQAAAEFVQILAIFSEGTTVLYGTRRERCIRLKHVIDRAREFMRLVLQSRESGHPQ